MLTTLQNKRADLEKDIAYHEDEIKRATDRIAFIDELLDEYNEGKETEERTLEMAHTAEYYDA